MKKYIFIFGTMLITLSVYAQANKSTQEILMSKTWRWGDNSELYYEFTFTRDSVFGKINGTQKHNYKGFDTCNPYYLSDTNDSKFINSKIGKKESGQYLIYKNTKALKIILATDKQIKFMNINNNNGKGSIIYNAID